MEVQARCIGDKEKELLKENIDKGEYILLENVNFENAKFDSNKCVLETAVGETCRLPNLYLYLGKD